MYADRVYCSLVAFDGCYNYIILLTFFFKKYLPVDILHTTLNIDAYESFLLPFCML